MEISAAAHEYFLDRLQSVRITTEPFPHFYCESIFEPEFYATLLQALPQDGAYARMAPPYDGRLHIDLGPASAAALGGLWPAFEAWLQSQAVLEAMAGLFAPYLAAMHRHRAEQVRSSLSGDGAVRIQSRSMLARDFAAYSIGPHTDSPGKFVVGIFYLPKDEAMAGFGTSIYRPRDPDLRGWKTPHMDRGAFELVQTFPYRPNSLFCFMKTDNSFHGVEPAAHPDGGRDVLFWLPEVGGERGARTLSLPRALFEAPLPALS